MTVGNFQKKSCTTKTADKNRGAMKKVLFFMVKNISTTKS